MAHKFKVGEMVECIDNSDGDYHYVKVGKRYVVTSTSPGYVAMLDETGLEHLHLAERFAQLLPDVKEFIVTSRTSDIEGRLMATWLAVPANCCRACSAPLPCAYHPNG